MPLSSQSEKRCSSTRIHAVIHSHTPLHCSHRQSLLSLLWPQKQVVQYRLMTHDSGTATGTTETTGTDTSSSSSSSPPQPPPPPHAAISNGALQALNASIESSSNNAAAFAGAVRRQRRQLRAYDAEVVEAERRLAAQRDAEWARAQALAAELERGVATGAAEAEGLARLLQDLRAAQQALVNACE